LVMAMALPIDAIISIQYRIVLYCIVLSIPTVTTLLQLLSIQRERE